MKVRVDEEGEREKLILEGLRFYLEGGSEEERKELIERINDELKG